MLNTSDGNLKSSGVAKVLMPTLKVRLGLAALSAAFSLVEVVLPFLYGAIAGLDVLVAIAALICNIISLIVALVWIYNLHLDLKNFYNDYPIEPGASLARFMIPFYNLWGIWNTLMTMAGRFKTEAGLIQEMGDALKSWIPKFYGIAILSNILNRAIFRAAMTDPTSVPPILYLITALVDLGLAYVLLEIAKTILTAIHQKANLSNKGV
jgi:hypothetical protein